MFWYLFIGDFHSVDRALDTDLHCTEALKYQVIYLLSREGNYSEVSAEF